MCCLDCAALFPGKKDRKRRRKKKRKRNIICRKIRYVHIYISNFTYISTYLILKLDMYISTYLIL